MRFAAGKEEQRKPNLTLTDFPVEMSAWVHSVTRLSSRLLGQVPRSGSRGIKRWVSPTLREIVKRKNAQEPQPEPRRSSFLEWNEQVELSCFCKRLGEAFDENVLKEAFVQQEWANMQEFQAKEAGDASFVPIEHNLELAEDGAKIISDTIKEVYSQSYPPDVVKAVHDYLTTDAMLAHVGKHLGIKDLIKSLEYPPAEKTVADTFRAVVGALASSSPPERVQQFVKDFVLCQMVAKDVYDIWVPEKPYEYLMGLLEKRGIGQVEPRLCNQSATNTILANFQIGLYNAKDKACLGLGWGENIQTATDTAALDAIQRIYSSHASQ